MLQPRVWRTLPAKEANEHWDVPSSQLSLTVGALGDLLQEALLFQNWSPFPVALGKHMPSNQDTVSIPYFLYCKASLGGLGGVVCFFWFFFVFFHSLTKPLEWKTALKKLSCKKCASSAEGYGIILRTCSTVSSRGCYRWHDYIECVCAVLVLYPCIFWQHHRIVFFILVFPWNRWTEIHVQTFSPYAKPHE